VGSGAATARTTSGRSVLLVLAGAIAVLASIRFLHWYEVPAGHDSSGAVTFAKLHASADQLGGAGVASAYFGWLAWVLLIAGIPVGVAAAIPSPLADPLRVLGFLIGLIGAGGTYYALAQHFNATGSTDGVLHNSSWGLWSALGGFAAMGLGAALGPRRS
jgi:hypothetical protein